MKPRPQLVVEVAQVKKYYPGLILLDFMRAAWSRFQTQRAQKKAPKEYQPTEAECRQMLSRFAWKFCRQCKGKGFRVKDGISVGCHCAEKRIRRALQADAAR